MARRARLGGLVGLAGLLRSGRRRARGRRGEAARSARCRSSCSSASASSSGSRRPPAPEGCPWSDRSAPSCRWAGKRQRSLSTSSAASPAVLTIGLVLGFAGLLLRAALGETPRHRLPGRRPGGAPLRGLRRPRPAARPHDHLGAPDAGGLAVLAGPLPGHLRLGLRPRARGHDADPVPDAARAARWRALWPATSRPRSRSRPSTGPRGRSRSSQRFQRPATTTPRPATRSRSRVLPLKRLVGATALVIAALIVIS